MPSARAVLGVSLPRCGCCRSVPPDMRQRRPRRGSQGCGLRVVRRVAVDGQHVRADGGRVCATRFSWAISEALPVACVTSFNGVHPGFEGPDAPSRRLVGLRTSAAAALLCQKCGSPSGAGDASRHMPLAVAIMIHTRHARVCGSHSCKSAGAGAKPWVPGCLSTAVGGCAS